MRKIEAAMCMAVRSCVNGCEKGWRSGNTSVDVEHDGIQGQPGYIRDVVVRLHGNKIARFDSALNYAKDCRGLRITDAGWQTATTKSRLNALLACFAVDSAGGLYQKKGKWFMGGVEFHGTDWLSYGWRTGYACQEAERLCKPSERASESVYDVDWHRAMGETLAAARVAAAVTALA